MIGRDLRKINCPDLLFFRHSPVRRKGICYGQSVQETEDRPEQVAARFLDLYQRWLVEREQGGARPRTQIWSSPAPRCREPAQLIADRLKLDLRVDPRLYELSLGDWEGRTWDDLEHEAHAPLHHWMRHWQTASPPNGESLPAFEERIFAWYQMLCPELHHVLIGHAGVWRAILVHAHQLSWDDEISRPVGHMELYRLRDINPLSSDAP